MATEIATLLIAGGIELAKLLMQMSFTSLRLNGKSEEEIDKIYQAEKAKFKERHAADLPDV